MFVISSIFLWDGEMYSNYFFLSKNVICNCSSLVPGDVIELTSFKLVPPSNMRITMLSYSKINSFTYILYTPLSIQAIPKPVSMNVFDSYISATSRLSVLLPETTQQEKRSFSEVSQSRSFDWRQSLEDHTTKQPYLFLSVTM